MSYEKKIDEIFKKIDVLIKITAIGALKDKNMTEQVKILSSIDLQPKEIADIIGTDSATVSTLKSRIKNKSESKTQKIAVPPSEEKINGY